jgi:16S rRNA (cytosine1402-N4)-methyltransferase
MAAQRRSAMKAVQDLWHRPVMPQETVRYLRCRPGGFYVDGTVGGGGHSELILKATSPDGRVLGIDRDREAIEEAGRRLKLFGKRISLVHGTFSALQKIFRDVNAPCADGILLDLGVSSHQLEIPERGFAFKKNGPLDMRMDTDLEVSAKEVVRNAGEEELARIIFEFGEERYARKIARKIVNMRREKPIERTFDLAEAVKSCFPSHVKKDSKIHPATRTFQALRIYVNDELGELSRFLDFGPELLCPGGRLVIISYHSLEDRLVKKAFKEREKSGGFILTSKRAVFPSEDEKKENPRSRSAKLRVIERKG